MNRFWFERKFGWGTAVLIILTMAGCTGNGEAEATVQAVVEQVVSTSTPTPLPPTPTPTLVPPTRTATLQPIQTAVPPTPTATPALATLLQAEDEIGDAFNCETQAFSDDQEVDFAGLLATAAENKLSFHVLMAVPLENDFSFAVLLALQSELETVAYIWEVHDEVLRLGQIDIQTGDLVPDVDERIAINHDIDRGELTFTVPYSITTNISSTVSITQTATSSQLFFSSFHTPSEGEPKNCDMLGPLTLPGSRPASP